jgi:hypothetical protein
LLDFFQVDEPGRKVFGVMKDLTDPSKAIQVDSFRIFNEAVEAKVITSREKNKLILNLRQDTLDIDDIDTAVKLFGK